MKENIVACINELSDWYIKNKSELDGREIGAIIRRNCNTTFEEYYIRDYLASEQGKVQFKTALLEKAQKMASYLTVDVHRELFNKLESMAPGERQMWALKNNWGSTEDSAYRSLFSTSLKNPLTKGESWRGRATEYINKYYPEPSNLRETLPETGESCQQLPSGYRDLLPYLDQYPSGSFLIEESTSPGTAKIDAILQKLKDGVAAIQDSTLFREYLLTMSKFWSYSVGNLILIMLQKRDATRVAGFTTWKELGRFVKAGEKGIMILAPCLPPKGGYEYWMKGESKYSTRYLNGEWFIYNINTKQSEGPHRSKVDAEAELIHRGFSKMKEAAETYESPRYFKVVYVFDISQTAGKELPVIEVKSLTGDANPDLWEKMINLLKRKNVNVSFEPRPNQDPSIKGQFSLPKDIWVRPEESPAQQLKTLIHETGHYYTEAIFMTARADAETIAESVAFVVGAHFGFDSGTRSFPYVAVWSQDKKVLEKNLASIKNISSSILGDLEA